MFNHFDPPRTVYVPLIIREFSPRRVGGFWLQHDILRKAPRSTVAEETARNYVERHVSVR